jgi:hypothetical protein
MPTDNAKVMLAIDYLVSPEGKKAVEKFTRMVEEIGRKPSGESGYKYCVAHELNSCLNTPGATCSAMDFPVLSSILDKSPDDVADAWMNWTSGETAQGILDSDAVEHREAVMAAFVPWSIGSDGKFLDESLECRFRAIRRRLQALPD